MNGTTMNLMGDLNPGLNYYIINRNNILNSDHYRDVAGCSDNEWSAGIAFTEE